MSHPIPMQFVGRGDPEDNLRCDGCGGFLSFEMHDANHKLVLWNRDRQADAKAAQQKAFDKHLKDEAKMRERLTPAQKRQRDLGLEVAPRKRYVEPGRR